MCNSSILWQHAGLSEQLLALVSVAAASPPLQLLTVTLHSVAAACERHSIVCVLIRLAEVQPGMDVKQAMAAADLEDLKRPSNVRCAGMPCPCINEHMCCAPELTSKALA